MYQVGQELNLERNPIYAATMAHNRLFNPTLHPDTEVLGFEPNWDACSSDPSVMRWFETRKESEMTKIVQNFCEELTKLFSIPLFQVNETLSSYEAEEKLKKNIKLGQHNKQEIDKMAAAIIVQSWLDQQ